MKLAVDVMGFENDISEAIKACTKFCKLHQDVNITLVGDKQKIIEKLNKKHNFDIYHASQVVEMTDDPFVMIRSKTDSSMYKTIELAKENKVDGVLSAGSTNCFISCSYVLLGLIKGVNKPAFLVTMPTSIKNKNILLLDAGANKSCTASDLHQFAIMSNIYATQSLAINNPSTAIVNIGTEKNKGLDLHHETFNLLEHDKSINFKGYIEPRYLLTGKIDIALADGYSGNLTLKSLEAGLKSIGGVMKAKYKKPWNWLGFLFSIPVLSGIKKIFDYRRNAGAIVIGLTKPVIKTHGDADAMQFYSSLECLYKTVKNNVVETITKNINESKNR